MLAWIIQLTIISLVLIFLMHHLFLFFKTNLTSPKIKDLVNKPHQQYTDIINTINNGNSLSSAKTPSDTKNPSNAKTPSDAKNPSDIISSSDTKSQNESMKNELKNYLFNLNKTGASTGSSELPIESQSSTVNNYSTY